MSKFKVGDSVRICSDIRAGDDFNIYVNDPMADMAGNVVTIEHVAGLSSNGFQMYLLKEDRGDWKWTEDLLTTIEGEAKVARRTFKLIKDTPTHKKGTLFQEQCDDGTQPYIVLNPARYDDFSIKDRKLVEEQPQWFIEVFQVEPQFMTREELDRWEAYKAGQPAKAKSTPKPEAVATASTVKVSGISDEHIAKFVRAYNSSHSTKTVAEKMNVSQGTVHAYKHIAVKRGHVLKTMKRAKAPQKVA